MRDGVIESQINPLLLTREAHNFLITVTKQHSNRLILHRCPVPRPERLVCSSVDLTGLQIKGILGVGVIHSPVRRLKG